MLTIFDYIKYNKDISLKDLSWNMMDILLCSILVHLPVNGFDKVKKIQDVYDEAKEVDNPKSLGVLEPKSIEIAKLILDSDRYRELEFSNFVKLKNEDTQFGAGTFRIKDITIVSFQGTDYSTIGWLENFRLAYQYPTHTQKLAVDYLKNTLRLLRDKKVYVAGHSKGGNLAMASVMECSKGIYNRIKQIYNFDGPGFREEEYNSEKYKRMSEKLINIVPSGSVIGVLMNNENYLAVKTNCIGFNSHFPNNWLVKENSFVNGELSYLSKQIHKSTTIGFRDLGDELINDIVETMFNAINEDKTADIKFSLENIIKVHNKLKSDNPKIFDGLDAIFNSMVEAVKDRNKVDF